MRDKEQDYPIRKSEELYHSPLRKLQETCQLIKNKYGESLPATERASTDTSTLQGLRPSNTYFNWKGHPELQIKQSNMSLLKKLIHINTSRSELHEVRNSPPVRRQSIPPRRIALLKEIAQENRKLLGRLKATKPTYCFETTVPRSTEGRLLRASSWDWCGGWRMEKSKGMENSKGMEKSKGKRHQKHDNKQNPEMNGVFSTFGRVGSVGSIVGGNKKQGTIRFVRERLVDNLEEKGMNERKAMQNVSKFGLVRGKGLVFLIEPQTGRQRKPKE